MIDVKDLAYRYPGAASAAVKGISFSVAPGEIFGFLGPSGAGKSTTQKVLIRLLKDFTGEVQVLGKDLRLWRNDYYERIGVSFELPNHYQKLTALENLRLFRALYHRETEEPMALLEMVGLQDDADSPVSTFSKGMQMRLNFVRALLHRPELIFLDEPTSGMDPANARKVKEIILDLKRGGRTIFLTTHDMNVAGELCDRVAFIVDGRIALIDAPRALKLKYGSRQVRVEYRHNGATATQEFPLANVGRNPAFLALIRDHEVETIHTQEATLEEIFIRVTGRSLQ
ncbi:MAG TPA: ABC transporter ATP-binding protein [Caldilineaceae bacterium]|nr:ABC transporter ATP-binding protein [Caldilineaceae bacterium]